MVTVEGKIKKPLSETEKNRVYEAIYVEVATLGPQMSYAPLVPFINHDKIHKRFEKLKKLLDIYL